MPFQQRLLYRRSNLVPSRLWVTKSRVGPPKTGAGGVGAIACRRRPRSGATFHSLTRVLDRYVQPRAVTPLHILVCPG